SNLRGLLLPVLSLLCVFSVAVSAAELQRRTYLGLQFDLQDKSAPGLAVTAVMPGSTAAAAGIRPGDRLTSVGEVNLIKAFDDLRQELGRTTAGQRIFMRYYRGPNNAIRVSPPLSVLPREEVPGSLVRYEQVSVDGIRQRLILTEPIEGSRALVFFLQGLGCSSVDYWLDVENPVKRLIDVWAAAGYATARLEKRGAGDSDGPECSDLSFEDERRGYQAALEALAGRGFDERIFLFGHGFGGVLAPLVTSRAVAGVMVYGTVAEPWFDYAMMNFERQDRLAGYSEEEIARRQTLREAFQTGLLVEGLTPAELRERIDGVENLEDDQLATDDHYDGRSVAFFVALGAHDPGRAWRQVWQPTLAIHGSYDWKSTRQDHERIARLTGGKFQTLPGLDHDFMRYESEQQSFVSQGTGRFAGTLVDATVAWMTTVPLPEPPESPSDAMSGNGEGGG
ncbi:MAG: alpha/beta hydrolase, partial [Pseudomonadota bacterium]